MAADGGWHPLADGCPPRWANGWGQDKYGVFVSFKVGGIRGVEQRLRWMRPGSFMMGSPKEDGEAHSDERPQHEVLITRGFWLADTPVTQALWEAVMGKNPSRFKGDPQRPVEKVTWQDCQRFCVALEKQVPGLGARLPREAEWEYACRAGTTTVRYCEELKVEGRPATLGDIAWYERISDGQTQPVGQKLANAWGLHDTLGNVWEWCMDTYARYAPHADEVQRDPSGPTAGGSRVFRGGSWSNTAGFVRAAFRDDVGSGMRNGYLGLRLARDQEVR